MLKKLLKIERLSNIEIPKEFEEHPPRYEKIIERQDYYLTNNKFKVPIVINKNNILVDGYTSYLIALVEGKKYVKVERV